MEEDFGLRALYRRVAGLDVHRMLHVVTVLLEQPDGSMQRQTRQFDGFRRECRDLAAWLAELRIELVVMESTGIYWKSVHAHLENVGIAAWVVNAHLIKHVPRRKTDMSDSQWLAVLARFGLVRASFIPPKDLRELRLVSRYRRKLSAMCASEVNRLHKILDDGGIKLGGVVSDINGVSARAMVSALIQGQPVERMLGLARGRLQQKREELGASLEGDLSARHLFVLGHIQAHVETLQRELAEMVPFDRNDAYEPKHPDVARINPSRQVPVLIDGDLELFDSTQIFEYLEDLVPSPPLWPPDVPARARARQIEHMSDEVFFPHVIRLMGLQHDMQGAAAVAACLACARFYDEMERTLAHRDFLAGPYSFADMAFYMAYVFADRKGAVITDATPRLLAWRDRVGVRPAVREVVGPMMDFLASQGRPVPAFLQSR